VARPKRILPTDCAGTSVDAGCPKEFLMNKPSLLAGLTALVLSGLCFASAIAAPIPADAARQPKTLWRLVMEDYYGPYDQTKKCWVARLDDEQVCMRPHRLDQVSIRGVNHLFLVIGGAVLGDDGEPRQSHADAGALGLIIFKTEGSALALVAKNDLHSAFGTFGAVPAEDQFELRQIGPDDTYGWLATSGWMGQGHNITSATIFAARGQDIVSLGDIPNHYDNQGNCENGKVLGSGKPCTDYSAELTFDTSDQSARFYPVIMKIAGAREGVTLDQTFTTTFDEQSFTYKSIEGLPEEFANGI
jgi:hypothetical protein